VEKYVAVRTKALALTDGTALADGDVTLAASQLVDSCHECNTKLSVVMSVIWHRLNRTEKKHMSILLALHLLKTLVSCGPLTAITEALDGAGKIYELKSYSDAKSVDHNSDVRHAADQVYGLLVDLSSLFLRRQQIAFAKAKQHSVLSTSQNLWADYLSHKLPLTTEGKKLHALFRPDGVSEREFIDTSASKSDYTPSIMALSRLSTSLRKSTLETYDEDIVDDVDDVVDQHFDFDENGEGSYMPSVEAPLDGEFRSNLQTHDEMENDREDFSGDMEHNLTVPDPFFEQEQQEQFSFPAQSFNSQNGANMLDSFNYAVSSHGGTSQSGSQFGSERSGSPLPGTWNAKKAAPSMHRINEVMSDFSFSEDVPPHHVPQESEETADMKGSYLSGFGQEGKGRVFCAQRISFLHQLQLVLFLPATLKS